MLAICLSGAGAAGSVTPPSLPDGSTWSTLRVPGGLDAAAAAVGIDRPLEPTRAVLELVRRIYDPPQGLPHDTAALRAALRTHLRSAAATTPAEDRAPLPLGPAFWTTVVFDRAVPDDALFAAVLDDRRAALFYVGLSSLDAPTLAFLGTAPDLAQALVRQHVAAFAAFSRSLQVRDGRLQLPGGDEAIDLWEHLSGESTANVTSFVERLFAREGGRLAYLLDGLAALDAPRQRFVLGLALPDAAARRTHAQALLRAVSAATRAWDLEAQPFSRPLVDPLLVLQQVAVTDRGELAAPAGRRFLTRALASFDLPRDPERELAGSPADEVADAAWLAGLVGHQNVDVRRKHRDALLFAQRLVRLDERASIADVLVATRAVGRYRLALLTLERMAIADAGVYARIARTADALSRTTGAGRATALAQFQGALAAIERAHAGGALDLAAATRLVRILSDVSGTGRVPPDGRVAAFVARDLLPALDVAPASSATSAPAEARLVRAWAGCADPATTRDVRVEWEDATYRLDRCQTEVDRIERLRARQRAIPLDAALAVHAHVAALRDPGVDIAQAAAAVRSMADIARAVETIAAAHADLDAVGRAADRLARATAALDRAVRRGDRRALARLAAPLDGVVDWLVADALTGLVYAAALGDPDGRLARATTLPRRHDFGADADVRDVRWSTPWQLGVEHRSGRGAVFVRGSLLALDVALAMEALWRLSLAPPPQAPRLATAQNAGLAELVALMNPRRLTDEGRDAIGAAMTRGRERLAAAIRDGMVDALAGPAGLDGWRRAMLPWTARHHPDRLGELFTPREILELGVVTSAASARWSLDEWGAPAQASTGCLCLRFPGAARWDRDTGRPSSGTLAAQGVEAAIVVAEFLHERRLPAALARDILAGLMQQLVDDAPALHFDDWFSVARYVAGVPHADLEDLVAALAARGPLVPLSEAEAAEDR